MGPSRSRSGSFSVIVFGGLFVGSLSLCESARKVNCIIKLTLKRILVPSHFPPTGDDTLPL